VDFFLSWTVEIILLTELCLPPYETRAFALALGVSFQNQNLTKLARSVTVNFGFKMIVNICLIMFLSLGMQSTILQRPLLVLPLIAFSRRLPPSQHWYVKFPDIYLYELYVLFLECIY
jgi:hypothetical protein